MIEAPPHGGAFCILKANNPEGTGPMDGEPHNLGKSAGNRGKGRPKGVPNKITADLKRAILEAAEMAGGDGGTAGYLARQAEENPAAFMSLLGKVLPTTISGDGENPLNVVTRIELVAGGK